jgi:hypothetical protein
VHQKESPRADAYAKPPYAVKIVIFPSDLPGAIASLLSKSGDRYREEASKKSVLGHQQM